MAHLLKFSLEEENEVGTSRRVMSELNGEYFAITLDDLLPTIEEFIHGLGYQIDGKDLKLVDKRI